MTTALEVSSSAFTDGGPIPRRYSCRGERTQPDLMVRGLPDETQSIAIVMDDPDAPFMTFTHWVLFDIPARAPELLVPEDARDLDGMAVPGRNSIWRRGWTAPCAPFGEHRYIFHVYALDALLGAKPGISAKALRRAMEGHVVGEATLVGRFGRRQAG